MPQTQERLPTAVESILDLVGNTPLLKVHTLDTGTCELFLKMESQNPFSTSLRAITTVAPIARR